MSSGLMSDPGQHQVPPGTRLGGQPDLFLDEPYDPIQVVEIDASAAAHVIYGATPGDNIALSVC